MSRYRRVDLLPVFQESLDESSGVLFRGPNQARITQTTLENTDGIMSSAIDLVQYLKGGDTGFSAVGG